MLTMIVNENGQSFVNLDAVEVIGAPLARPGHSESRMIVLRGNTIRAYALNTAQNCEAMRSILPPGTIWKSAAPPPKKKRAKKDPEAES